MSVPFAQYVQDLWLSLFFDSAGNYVHRLNNTSSTYQPFFSWLSMYTEFGLIGLGTSLAFLAHILFRTKKHIRFPNQRLTALSIGAGSLFLFLLGLQENYWETPQAIFIGLLLMKVQYANLVNKPDPQKIG
jgi:hypothetical protein